jgi:hypothetical protein
MSKLMRKWTGWLFAALAAAAFAVAAFEGVGEDASGEASGAVREFIVLDTNNGCMIYYAA